MKLGGVMTTKPRFEMPLVSHEDWCRHVMQGLRLLRLLLRLRLLLLHSYHLRLLLLSGRAWLLVLELFPGLFNLGPDYFGGGVVGVGESVVLEQTLVAVEELLVDLSLHILLVDLLDVVLGVRPAAEPFVALGAPELEILEMLDPVVVLQFV